MTTLNIVPFKSCGPIFRGEDFRDISKRFPDHEEFTKNQFSEFCTSIILDGNMHVFYSSSGACKGVEVFPPLIPSWDNLNLFSGNLKGIGDVLTGKGVTVEISDSGLLAPTLGISLYSYDFDESLICEINSVYVSFEA